MSKKKDRIDASILERLYDVLVTRKDADPSTSYTAKMYAKGLTKIAQKVGEEGVETALAAVAEGRDELLNESADLLYMLLLLWAAKDVKPEEVFTILDNRFGKTGIRQQSGG
ncbi:MAG: phosphoribosyl-ATP diphosphatase [Rhodospirillaceae bacterium]|jgi:phosphoribosyl-ATP pyrophosphohydrolase|nr:phosphoribosyl-ATP diphosphatase [Rhodospirillaceae bacterium]